MAPSDLGRGLPWIWVSPSSLKNRSSYDLFSSLSVGWRPGKIHLLSLVKMLILLLPNACGTSMFLSVSWTATAWALLLPAQASLGFFASIYASILYIQFGFIFLYGMLFLWFICWKFHTMWKCQLCLRLGPFLLGFTFQSLCQSFDILLPPIPLTWPATGVLTFWTSKLSL